MAKNKYNKLIFKNTDDFICNVLFDELKTTNRENDVTVVGYYDTIIEILNYCMRDGNNDFCLVSCDIAPPDFDGYDDAYMIQFDVVNGKMYVEKAAAESGKYLIVLDDLVFIEEDFVDGWVETNESENMIVFGFSDITNVNSSDVTERSVCVDNDMLGFCACSIDDVGFHTFKYRGNSKLTKNDIDKILADNGWD